MKEDLIAWLGTSLSQVPDVRLATNRPDNTVIFHAHQADLVVATWMGARLYVYVYETAPKLRDMRGLLKENSRHGIGSLFMVAEHLLPAHESESRLADWQEGLMGLHDDFIYAYSEGEANCITQVHFTPLGLNDIYRIWHFRDFVVENVSVRKREVQNSLRGDWFLGDITSPNYKRRINYERANQRFHYRTKYTQEIPHPNGSKAAKNQDELAKYYALLEVERNASEEEIKRAFRRKALQVHPDVSALPRQEANRRFMELNEAYEFIKNYYDWV